MKYLIGQKVTYNAIDGKKEEAIIIAKKDPKTGTIRTENASGNFDFLISVEKNGKTEQHFCNESEIK